MHYPEDEVGPVISLAVDRNNDLWISTASGGASIHARFLAQSESSAGQEAWHPRHDDGRRGGTSGWLLQLRGPVGRNHLPPILLPNGARGVSESTMSVRGTTSGSVDQAESSCLATAFLPSGLEKPGPAPAESPAWWKQSRGPLDEWILRHHSCLCRRVSTVASRPELPRLRRTPRCVGWTSRALRRTNT